MANTKKGYLMVNGYQVGDIVDTALSATSENPIQNKAVYAALGQKLDTATYNANKETIDNSLLELATHSSRKTAAERNSFVVIKDITNDIYNTASTLWTKLKNGDFSEVNVGNYIIGKKTGTKYWIVDCDYYYDNRTSGYGIAGYAENTHHLAIMPEVLKGVSTLLWTGKTYAGSNDNNTLQGCAPWAVKDGVGVNDTIGAYSQSYIRTTVLKTIHDNWLKADFEDYGISILPFYELNANQTNTSAVSASCSLLTGVSSNWIWENQNTAKCTLPSIQNFIGGNGWQSSAYDCGVLKEMLSIFKAGMSYQYFLGASDGWQRATWTKNVASATSVCHVDADGASGCTIASFAAGVRPLAFIAVA